MADVVINHRVGTTKGSNGMYNRYDGIPISWDEHAVTSCSGGKVAILQRLRIKKTKNKKKPPYKTMTRVLATWSFTSYSDA